MHRQIEMSGSKLALSLLLILFVFHPSLIIHVHAAAPSVTSFSSTGGSTVNKDNNQDVMYRVSQGNNLTFSVTASEAADFEWQVNKAVTRTASSLTNDSLNWTVPGENNIWEIHLKINNTDGEAHQEWVVSTLTPAEAPEFFDYFTDGLWHNRTMTDPWGRALPEWQKNRDDISIPLADATKFILITNGDSSNSKMLIAPHSVKYGTWKAKFRYTAGFGIPQDRTDPTQSNNNLFLSFKALFEGTIPVGRPPIGAGCNLFGSDYQGHNHPGFIIPDGSESYYHIATAVPVVGGWGVNDFSTYKDTLWKDLKMIRTADGYFRIWKGTGRYGHNGYFTNTLMNTNKVSDSGEAFAAANYIGIMSRYYDTATTPNISATPAYWTEVDGIEIYRDKSVSPPKISYGDYVYTYEALGNTTVPVYRQGILVDGFDVHLQDIANAVPGQFTYDPASKTAVCNADLCLSAGAELLLDHETLKMHCESDGQHQIVVKDGATLKLSSATVTADTSYYYGWVFPSEYTPNLEYDGMYLINFNGRLTAEYSKIEHCGGLYLVGADTLHLIHTQLTDLVDVTYPANLGSITYRNWSAESGRTHSLSFRAHQPCSDFTLKNLKISGKDKITLQFLSMDPMVGEPIRGLYEKPMPGGATLYDSVLENADIVVKAALMYYWGYTHPSTLNLVNTKFGGLTCATDKAWIVPKYYLDVKVQDQNGNPVSAATVTVTNTVNVDFAPENLATGSAWVKECGYNDPGYVASPAGVNVVTRKKPRYGYPLSETLTGDNGQTPLPADAAHTLILADYLKSQTAQTNFIYTIKAEKNGLMGSVLGVDLDENWYRQDPGVPVKTILVTLGQETDLRVASSDKSVRVYPNPYIQGESQGTQINFGNLPAAVKIRIYTLNGTRVTDLAGPENMTGGFAAWDVRNAAAGVYLYIISSQDAFVKRGKLSIIR